MPLELPRSGPPNPAELVRIQASGDGGLYWNNQEIKRDELPPRVAALIGQSHDPKVVLVGDNKARFGATIMVLDELRKAGMKKYSVVTKTQLREI